LGRCGKVARRKLGGPEEFALAREGLISLPSARPVAELLDRLGAALAAKRITVFARIDHAAGAASVGMALPPTSVLIFGNPQAGTPLMQADQRIGLDLPLRMLAWQDAEGRSWLTYHDPAWLVRAMALTRLRCPRWRR
jgi:uncharacterized protein (DUF302 family)